jgi:hypothetical protein
MQFPCLFNGPSWKTRKNAEFWWLGRAVPTSETRSWGFLERRLDALESPETEVEGYRS